MSVWPVPVCKHRLFPCADVIHPLAAGSIASPRANRFVESLFTAPVERNDWLVARVLVLFTLALGYYVALVPMMLVYVTHVGLPVLLAKLVAWTFGILLVSVAVGTLIEVLFIGRMGAMTISSPRRAFSQGPTRRYDVSTGDVVLVSRFMYRRKTERLAKPVSPSR